MNQIGINADLMSFLSGNLTISSSKLYKLDIAGDDNGLVIDVYLELLYSEDNNHLKLRFTDVQEYSFYYNSQHVFYNVEIYKFFINNGRVYISFDPVDEQENISVDDQDFILSKKVEGYIFQK